MKLHSSFNKRILAMAGFALLSASSAWAVFPFAWTTDGASAITGGTWTGGGSVMPNISSGTFVSSTNPGAKIAVNDFQSGILGLDSIGGNAASNIYDDRLETNLLTATHSISLTGGGSADLRLHNSTSNDGGTNLFNSVGLTGFTGNVTSITWTTRFSSPIAGRNDGPAGGAAIISLTTRPMGMGLALITPGTRPDTTNQTTSSFTVAMSYTDIYYESAPNVFVDGVPQGPQGAVARQSVSWDASAPGATSFTANTFDGTNFLLVRGYDVGGTAGYEATDAPKVYMREMSWTITPKSGSAFQANTVFVTSMDGAQYTNYSAVIPEPTSLLLIAGSLLGGCFLRRRRP